MKLPPGTVAILRLRAQRLASRGKCIPVGFSSRNLTGPRIVLESLLEGERRIGHDAKCPSAKSNSWRIWVLSRNSFVHSIALVVDTR